MISAIKMFYRLESAVAMRCLKIMSIKLLVCFLVRRWNEMS